MDRSDWAIDIVVGLHTPEVVAMRPGWGEQFFGGKLGVDDELRSGVSLARQLEIFDEARVERMLLFATAAGPVGLSDSWHLPVGMVADAVEFAPDRFAGLVGVDPTAGMAGVRHLERAVSELGFVGAHGYPHWFGLPPDDRRWYPLYAKCCELDVPIQLQVGHCLAYNTSRPLPSVGRPITLDTVACDFPELKLIGIHTGWPWTEELISVAYKHQNVYIGIDAYAPRHLAPELVRFADSWGSTKVMFGTDFPVIDPRRARREIDQLSLREESLRLLLRGNAERVYGLDRKDRRG